LLSNIVEHNMKAWPGLRYWTYSVRELDLSLKYERTHAYVVFVMTAVCLQLLEVTLQSAHRVAFGDDNTDNTLPLCATLFALTRYWIASLPEPLASSALAFVDNDAAVSDDVGEGNERNDARTRPMLSDRRSACRVARALRKALLARRSLSSLSVDDVLSSSAWNGVVDSALSSPSAVLSRALLPLLVECRRMPFVYYARAFDILCC
jgi:hypothetical protein